MARSPAPEETPPALESELTTLGSKLVGALGSVLDRVPGRPSRPQELARLLGINKDLSSRVMVALRKREALAAVHHLPGAVPLRQLVGAAEKIGVGGRVASDAHRAINQFDEYVRREFGARSNLQGLLSTRVPDAREQLQATSKQAVFRGTSGIRGLEVGALVVTFMVHPSKADPAWCDTSVLNAYLGIRRSRPNAHFSFTTLQEGRDGTRGAADSMLSEFCSASPLALDSVQEDKLLRHTLRGAEFGRRHVTDLVTAEHYSKNHPVDPVGLGEVVPRWFYATIDHPARVLLFDVLVHEDVWPGTDPELAIYDTAIRGEVSPTDPARESDKIDLVESIDPFKPGLDRLRCAEVPRYGEMLERICRQRGWSTGSFRGYRVEVQYPLYGSQLCLLFSPG